MGNFYTNIVLRDAEVDAVIAVLSRPARRAYVAKDDLTTVVYDERCDRQDLDELQNLARLLSDKLGRAAIAFCNHDDDVLWYALAERGKITDTYDSYPGYFDGGSNRPKGGDARRLCNAFGVPDRAAEVDAQLRRTHDEVVFEIDRHAALLELLGLGSGLAMLGYDYVSRGEIADNVSSAIVRATGGAPELPTAAGRSPNDTRGGEPSAPSPGAFSRAEMRERLRRLATLAFNEVDVPPRFSAILGKGRVNGCAAMLRLKNYIERKRLSSATSGMITADDDLFALLGARQFTMFDADRLLIEALRIPLISEEDATAFQSGDFNLQRRFQEALTQAARAVALDDR